MVKSRIWSAAVVMLVAAMILPLAADARMPMSAEEVAAACIGEMDQVYEDTYTQLITIYQDLSFELENYPDDATIPQAFKLTTAESAKIDKLVASGVSRIQKTGTKCIAKLIRMDADTFIQGEVAESRAQSVSGLLETQALTQDLAIDDLIALIDG